MSLVTISIVGNVVKPPQQMCFASGRVKTTIVVAVDAPSRLKTDKPFNGSDFYRVEAWGKLGDIAHKYLSKGSLVGASGKLVISKWQDQQGNERMTPVVEASQIALPPRPRISDGSAAEIPTQGNPVNMQFEDTIESEAEDAIAEAAESMAEANKRSEDELKVGATSLPDEDQALRDLFEVHG